MEEASGTDGEVLLAKVNLSPSSLKVVRLWLCGLLL